MWCIRNLRAQETFWATPWQWTPREPLPESLSKKTARTRWSLSSSTDHCFYSGFEGLYDHLRVGKDNPPVKMFALVGDIDVALEPEVFQEALSKLPDAWVPQYVERTLSGKWRIVLPLSAPFVPGIADDLLWKRVLKELVKASGWNTLVGLDQAILTPSRYYFNHGQWLEVEGAAPLAVGRVYKILGDALLAGLEQDLQLGTLADPKAAWQELARLYPRFAVEWDGIELEPSAIGSTFWDPESTSEKSARVFATGIYSFADHNGGKAFWPWADLLGATFVEQDQGARDQKILQGVFFCEDENRYYVWSDICEAANDPWMRKTPDQVKSYLKSLGIDGKVPKGESLSDLDRWLLVIQERNKVKGISPMMFRERVVETGCGKLLNNYVNKRIVMPAEDPQVWGPTGNFPVVSDLLDTMWLTPENRLAALTFFKFAYEDQYYQQRNLKQVFCMVGAVQTGKTLFARGIMGKAVGGFYSASSWLIGQTNFTGDQWRFPSLCVDDGEMSTSRSGHDKLSERVKLLVSCSTVNQEKKFHTAVPAEWSGHTTISVNPDRGTLIKAVPSTGISSADKIILVSMGDKQVRWRQPDLEDVLHKEMPYFLRYLLDWQPPDWILSEGRYRMTAWKCPEMSRVLARLDAGYLFALTIVRWLKAKFAGTPVEEYAFGPVEVLEAVHGGDMLDHKWSPPVMNAKLHDLAQKVSLEDDPWLTFNMDTGLFHAHASAIPERL